MKKSLYAFLFVSYLLIDSGQSATKNQLESCNTEKECKSLIKSLPNLLILFSNNDQESKGLIKLLKEVNLKVKGVASIAYINCGDKKKVCKKLKVDPEPTELKHYNNGKFNTDYERSLTVKSLINFLADPTGDLPWEEEEDAQDVIHITEEKELKRLLKKSKDIGSLVMFYAPWCGHCKKLKPDYSKAATQLKGSAQMVAVNCDLPGNAKLKQVYNISGFPTLNYFKNNELMFPYGGEHNLKSLVDWMNDPSEPKAKEPEKSWAEEDDVHVTFLTDDNFDEFIESHKNVLVKFYAPWCGHCKTMKPIMNKVSKTLKEEGSENIIAFVDATAQEELYKRFKIKGFPTVKFFQDGEYAWDYNERDEEKILEFMRNPKKPEEPEKEEEWKDVPSNVIHADDSNFASIVKTKKHALGFFYAPWCGHCKTAKPHFADAANYFKDDLKVAFVAVDCIKSKAVCEKYDVKGFPTITYFNFGKNPTPYAGGREYKDFVKFMTNPNDPNAGKPDPQDDWRELPGNEHIRYLDDKSFNDYVESKSKVMVMFHAPWCGHCKNMKPAYAEAATELNDNVPGAYLAAVDATQNQALGSRFELKGFPTLKYFENGKFISDYSGGRGKDDIVNFMKDPAAPPPPPSAPVDDWTKHMGHEHVNMLSDNSFDEFINSKPKVLIMFYAPWCGHCTNMKPAYSEAALDMKKFLPGAYLAAVDATKHQALGQKFELKGFPTLKYFENGIYKFDYTGGRSKSDIIDFMMDPKDSPPTPPQAPPAVKDDWTSLIGHEHVNMLSDSSFDEFINSKGKVLVMLYAPWCGHCTNMKPAYAEAAGDMKRFLPGTYLAAVDLTKNQELDKKLKVRGFPTLKYYENGKYQFDYSGGRSKDDIINFMKDPKETPAIPAPPSPPDMPDIPKVIPGQVDSWAEIDGYENVNMLGDKTFDDFVKTNSKVLVMLYTPWCGHCKNMKPAIVDAAGELKKTSSDHHIAAVDLTQNPDLDLRFKLKAFPTIKYYENGVFKFDYTGGRSMSDIVNFMKDPKPKEEL